MNPTSRGRTMRTRSGLAAGLALAALIGTTGPTAAVDATPPTGGWTIQAVDAVARTVTLKLSFVDPESGMDRVSIWCDAGLLDVPYATSMTLPLYGPGGLGCSPGYGYKSLGVQPWNGAGVLVSMTYDTFELRPNITIETPRAPVTGELFTFRPTYPPDLVLSASTRCTWELRWGSTSSLRAFEPDATYGGLVFEGTKSKSFCGDWTFTLPWVPVRQYAVTLSIADDERNAYYEATIGGEGQPFVTAEVGSTDRHIRSSNLPIAYLLPERYAIIVGEPVTYRLYTRGGATIGTDSPWTAFLAGTNRGFSRRGGSSFTFVPSAPGDWVVSWNRYPSKHILGAYYDPTARRRDLTAPTTTAPAQRIAASTQPLEPAVLVRVRWSGSDRGWGIARYQLQRRRDGGPWRTVTLPTSRATAISQRLATGSTWAYRLRAVDRAGNTGSWRAGPTFRPRRVAETAAAVVYRGDWTEVEDAAASGGRYRTAAVAGASATLAFTGRDVAWIAPRGPGFGKAEVWVDGVRRAVVDLAAAAPTARATVFRAHWSTRGEHRVRVRVLGTTGRPTVPLDGFAVLR